jgi:hypothetical protein
MKAVDVIIDMIETMGIKPIPKNQWFHVVITGYTRHEVAGTDVVTITRENGKRIAFSCSGSKVYLSPSNPVTGDVMKLDLANPNSLAGLKSVIEAT